MIVNDSMTKYMAAETLPTQIELEIVTPDHLVVQATVTGVTIPGKSGYLGILPGHAPLLSEIVPGVIAYVQDNVTYYLTVSWGFVEVLADRVVVLAQTAERAEEIDTVRAEAARERAEERLKEYSDVSLDRERAREALAKAIARLETARHAKG